MNLEEASGYPLCDLRGQKGSRRWSRCPWRSWGHGKGHGVKHILLEATLLDGASLTVPKVTIMHLLLGRLGYLPLLLGELVSLDLYQFFISNLL